MNVKVTTMDAELEFAIQPSTTGKLLFEQVVKTIALREVWYFGLQYIDIKGDPAWLRLDKKVTSQDVRKEAVIQFQFRVKFYPEDVSEELIQDITKKLFYLQVRNGILLEEIFCPPDTAVLLASYACQAKYGDYDPEIHPRGFLARDKLLPQRVIDQHTLQPEEWEEKVVKWYSEHSGLFKEEAMMEYLKIAQDLEMYGVNYYQIKNKRGTQLWLGVDALGISVYQKEDKLNPRIGFPWHEVRNVAFKDKKFIIKPTDRKAQDFIFYALRLRINKRILSMCMGNHELYSRRRKPDTIEVQQMKAQAIEERDVKLEEKKRVSSERTARSEVERRLIELEQRMREKAAEHSTTVRQLEEHQARTRDLERMLAEENRQRQEIEDMRRRLEEKNLTLERSNAETIEERTRLQEERDAIRREIEQKNIELVSRTATNRATEEELARIRVEHERATRHLEELSVKEDSIGDTDSTDGRQVKKRYARELELLPNGDELARSVEQRQTAIAANRDLSTRLRVLEDDLKKQRDVTKLDDVDKTHETNRKMGVDKFRTLKKIREGNTKKRVDEFEAM